MPVQRTLIGLLVMIALVALSAPVVAGGFAVVRLDETPGDVLVATPWRFGFMVLQHDITPNSDVTPIVRAIHKETGEEVTVTGEQEGEVGHFVAEMTLPREGDWKWSIEPDPYPETSFETLSVLASSSARPYSASILDGSCASPEAVAFPLGAVEPQAITSTSPQLPVAVSSSTIETSLPELVAAGHAIGIGTDGPDSAPVACADIAAPEREDALEIVLGLQDGTNAENVGVAVLRGEGEQTAVTLYLLNPDPIGETRNATLARPDEAYVVEILDAWVFQPATLEVASGATVTWMNSSEVAHTVTGDDLAFDDSGLIEPGGSFSITFDAPGAYHYRCAPHPDMVGEIVVT